MAISEAGFVDLIQLITVLDLEWAWIQSFPGWWTADRGSDLFLIGQWHVKRPLEQINHFAPCSRVSQGDVVNVANEASSTKLRWETCSDELKCLDSSWKTWLGG